MAKGNLVWLASFPKSGNTWMRIFLNNYEENGKAPVSINQLDNSLHASSRILFDRFTGVLSSDLSALEIDYYRPSMYQWWSSDYKKITFVKVHEAWRKNHFGNSLFPADATYCVLYIVRNPFDIIPSYANHYNLTIDKAIQKINDDKLTSSSSIDKLTSQLPKQLIQSWSTNAKSWLDQSELAVHVVRYEDMLQAPSQTFGDVVEKLGFPKDEERLEKAIRFSSFSTLKEQEQQVGFRERLSIARGNFFNQGKIGNWRKTLTEEQVQKIIHKNKEMLLRFGYIDAQNTPIY